MQCRLAGSTPPPVLLSGLLLLLLDLICPAAATAQPPGDPATVFDVEPSAEGWQEEVECYILCPPPPIQRGSHPTQLTALGDRLFFSAFTFGHGRELWVSDGTAAGTHLVMDGCPGPCSGDPILVGQVAGRLVFWAEETDEGSFGRYWLTGGGDAAPTPVGGACDDGCHNVMASYGQEVEVGVEFDGALFFLAPAEDGDWPVLWRTDGGEAVPVTLDPASLGWPGSAPLTIYADDLEAAVVAGNGLYLVRQPDILSDQPPVLLRFESAMATPQPVVAGCQRWFNPIYSLEAGGGGVAFLAGCLERPGLRMAENARGVFFTDGTPRRTVRLYPEAGSPAADADPVPLGWVGESFYFAVDGDGPHSELWLGAPGVGSTPVVVVPKVVGGLTLGDRVFFRTQGATPAENGLGVMSERDHWVRQLAAGNPGELTPVGPELLFATEDEAGREPWITDGTEEGTRRLADLNPGPESSNPRGFTAGEQVYLSADDGIHDRELLALSQSLVDPDRCQTAGEDLCLADGRFRVRVRWTNQHDGGSQGVGKAVEGTGKAGFFWFFRRQNLELTVKVLDGTGINGYHWVFWGGITDLGYDLEVTDLDTGVTRTFRHAPGDLCGGADTTAFAATEEDLARDAARLVAELAAPAPAMTPAPAQVARPLSPPPCSPDGHRLCIGGGWGLFSVEATYRNQFAEGASGAARGVPLSGDAGWFWFFRESNPELMVKILYGEPNDHWWVFIGGLTTLEVEVTITDEVSQGRPIKTYVKRAESTCGIADVTAFPF